MTGPDNRGFSILVGGLFLAIRGPRHRHSASEHADATEYIRPLAV